MPNGNVSARLGVSDSASIVMPNAVLATMMWRIVISLRRAVDSAPISEPMLMIENSTVNVASPPWNVRCTSSGMTTWKLKASVPTIAIMTSGIHSSGSRRA